MKILATATATAALLIMALPGDASARSFPLAPGQTAVGGVDQYVTRYEDTLLDIARGNDLGYTQLVTANTEVDPWLPGKDRKVALPAFYLLPEGARRGIVINLAEQRLFYFPPGGHTVETLPIGVGVQGRLTPNGVTRVASKEPHPAWYPPASIRAEKPELPAYVAPGPDNPLGDYALHLGWPSYLIHGTNKPYGVGRNVSHGCIRLYPEDIDHLFHEVGVGTPVRVIDQDIVAAWVGKTLYVAAFPNKEQTDQIDVEEKMTPAIPDDLTARVTAVAGDAVSEVDWDAVKQVAHDRTGIPTPVTGLAVATSAAMPGTAADAPPPPSPPPAAENSSDLPAAVAPADATPEPDLPVTMAATPAPGAAPDQHGEDAATINRVLDSFPAK